MRAAVITQFGGPEVLEIQDVPMPEAVADQVLVRVYASALNRADLLQRKGEYPAPAGSPQDIPGLEFAGEIAAVGALVIGWQVGQRVFGISGGGAQAEYVVAHARMLMEIPAGMSWTEAAAIPEAFITAHDALWIQARLRPNERVLINAVGSGVGLAAVQLVKAIGAQAFGTARTQSKLERAKRLGMVDGWMVGSGKELSRAAAEPKFDVVLELAGGDYVGGDLAALALKGRLMLVGTMAGSIANINLSLVLTKRLRVTGTVLRSRPLEEKIAATQVFAKEALPLFAKGELQAVVGQTFSLNQIVEAHRYMESNSNTGKVVLSMREESNVAGHRGI
ncbi:MAG: NAD(P)H-quinone oxidoreductase [Acidobacteriaceae bacterium]